MHVAVVRVVGAGVVVVRVVGAGVVAVYVGVAFEEVIGGEIAGIDVAGIGVAEGMEGRRSSDC